MKFDDETRKQLSIDFTLAFDPSGYSVEIAVDGDYETASWEGDAEPTFIIYNRRPLKVWLRTATTGTLYRGHAAPDVDGAVTLNAGSHPVRGRFTKGLEIRVVDLDPIEVT